jgi:hypothetical protein
MTELPEGMSLVLMEVGRLVAPAVAAAIRKAGTRDLLFRPGQVPRKC